MKIFSYILLIFFAILIITNPVWAGTAILSWNPPMTNADGTPLTDLVGYKVYYGNSSGSLATSLDVGNVTQYTLDLTDGLTYYFAVTAYDTSGNESGFSNVVSKLIGTTTGGGSSPAGGGGCGMVKDINSGPKNSTGPLLLNLFVLFLLAFLGKLHCYLKEKLTLDFTSKFQLR